MVAEVSLRVRVEFSSMSIKTWRRQRLLRRHSLPDGLWQQTLAETAALQGLNAVESERLRALTLLFLHEKRFEPQEGLELDLGARLLIGAQACLPVLNLDLDYYRGWSTLIVYPDSFWVLHEIVDEAGILHSWREPRSGEAWPEGPVVLSWADILANGAGFNVVIHELAHKLDMLNGDADGFPRLHRDMSQKLWTNSFSRAYRDLTEQVEAGLEPVFDPYAAENPGEFFAVISEAFFELPQLLRGEYPHVYTQLKAFYRQDPAARTMLLGR
jgi:Mlc titration factor MtfA (ptsG expression regulator)